MAYAPDGGTLEYVITPGKTEVNKNSRRWFDGNFWYLCLRRRFAALRLVAAAPIAASAVTAAVAGPAVAFATARSVVAVRRSGLCRGRFRAAAAVAPPGRSLRRSRSLRPERSPRPPRPRPEPERPPPLRPPRPRPKRPRFSSGAYFGPSPTLSGNSALRMSRSMNFSIWWNLPCSSSLTNVMAAPKPPRGPYGRCGGCNPRGRAARRS